jgi:hypothetical protein
MGAFQGKTRILDPRAPALRERFAPLRLRRVALPHGKKNGAPWRPVN